MARDQGHIVAMTGSYISGEMQRAVPDAADEAARFRDR